MDNSKTKELTLPTIREYSLEEQQGLAKELRENDVPIARRFIKHYHKMVQETRVALNKIKKAK